MEMDRGRCPDLEGMVTVGVGGDFVRSEGTESRYERLRWFEKQEG